MSSITTQRSPSLMPPPWSPSPTTVLVGAGWVLLGAAAYLVASEPVVVLVTAVAALLVTLGVGTAAPHDGPGLGTGRTIDLAARLEREASRR